MSRAPLLLLLALLAGACDGPFEPTLEGGPAAAVYGTLDGRTTRQALRVQVLGEPLTDVSGPLAATVTSTELGAGATTAWRDSLVTLPSGEQAHVALAPLAVRPGETHRVEVVRSRDGARSTVDVRIPQPTATTGALLDNGVVPVDVAGLSRRITAPVFRYRVRRPDGSAEAVLVAPTSPQATPGGARVLAFLSTLLRRSIGELYDGGTGDVVFVEGWLEGVASSDGTAPVQDGVGEVGWVAPVSVPIPFEAAALAEVGFAAAE